jgi:colicin import membrane protein
MEGDNSRRLLQERESERLRQEQRREAERERQEDRLRELETQRVRLRGQREATHEEARRVQQGREEARARTATDRAAVRALANERRAEREEELKRAQLDREARRRAASGDRPQIDEAYKSALEYDIYVRNNFGTRESYMQQASRPQRLEAEIVFREIDAAAANGGKVSDPELLRYRIEQVRASVERSTARPKQRARLVAIILCLAAIALIALYLAVSRLAS